MSKCKVNVYDGIKNRRYTPSQFKMNYFGTKKPDTLSVKLPANNRIRKGDMVCLIHDIADVDYIKAVYNFNLSCKDESCFDNDPTVDPDETRFIEQSGSSAQFRGRPILHFPTGSSNPILYNNPDIDLSKQFDIIIRFSPFTDPFVGTGDIIILWSFTDGTNGLEIGITGDQVSGNDLNARAYVRIHDGVGTQTIVGNNEPVLPRQFFQSPMMIRVFRKADNVIRLQVMGVDDGDYTTSASLQPSGGTMRFGDSFAGSEHFEGYFYQVRVYCGGHLSEEDAERIRMSKQQLATLKFKGRVWKIDERLTHNIAHAQSISVQVLKSKIGSSAGASPPTSYPLSSTAFKTIAQTIVDEASTSSNIDFVVKIFPGDSFARAGLLGNIHLQGAAIDVLTILTVYAGVVFNITPQGIVIIETDNGTRANYEFDQNDGSYRYDIQTTATTNAKGNNELVFTGRGGTYGYSYLFPNDGINRTYRKNLFQLDNNGDLNTYANIIVLNLALVVNAGKRWVVKAAAYLHHIRTNHDVTIRREVGSTAQRLGVNDESKDGREIITHIEYNYPEGITVVHMGENIIDQYDEFIKTSSTQDGLVDTTL